ncbi:phenol hydroxylase subunit P4 [Thauera sp.]|jgi:phenol hydroxylase P4 protein|uniref:phenol hydroxylase subunit P4 n=1 Tax=Thauera sp. TaxID=1905334 RepID=UPI002A36D6A6|nr:phenol hydroxylase subunit P4 [Thauera sp.]MDX9887263.1 phenol hydroxylase subunit P4 [Thauera sp.]
MAVSALKEYIGVPRDSVEHFGGKQIVYVSWDRHLLFASPFMMCLPRDMLFGEMVDGPLKALVQPDPDSAAVDWHKVEWMKDNKPFNPDFGKSLAENGIGHKDQVRFHTPGLNSLLHAA